MARRMRLRNLLIPLAAILLAGCASSQLHPQVLGAKIDRHYSDVLRGHARTCAVKGCDQEITGHLSAPHIARTNIMYRLPACKMHMDRVREYTLAMLLRRLAPPGQQPPIPPTPLLLTNSALDGSKLIVTPPTHVLVREAQQVAGGGLPGYRIVQGPIEMIEGPTEDGPIEVIEDPTEDE